MFRNFIFLNLSKISTKMSQIRPKLIVFDLDYTLWPFHVEFGYPPFHKDSKTGQIIDGNGEHLECFPEVPEILEKLHQEGYPIAFASRTTFPDGGNKLVELFGWKKYVSYSEIYPGSKIAHFKKFHEQSGIAYDDMLFFDDDTRNVRDIRPLGVTVIFIEEEGMNNEALERGFREFAQNKKKKGRS